jgi:RHS repeat-associated protein
VTVAGSLDDPTARATVNGVAAAVSGDTFSLAGVPLAEGSNTLAIVASDPAGNASSANLTLHLDTVPPKVTIGAPANGLLTNVPRLDVAASVDEPILAAAVNDQPAGIDGQSLSLAGLELAEGDNLLTVTARDRADNLGNANVRVRLDTIPPAAPQFDVPLSPSNRPTVDLTGSAEPGATVRLIRRESGAADFVLFDTLVADAAGRFARLVVPLAEGVNAFTATAADPAGNQGPQALVVSVQRDSEAPKLSVVAPAAGALLNKAQPAIAASAGDEAGGSGLDPASLKLVLDGRDVSAAASLAGGTVSYKPAERLAEGGHSILLTLADRAGNLAHLAWSFTTDTVAPTPQVTSQKDEDWLNSPSIDLAGLIDDLEASISINGVAVTPGADGFSLAGFGLAEGSNQITVTAVDAAGNVGTATLTLNLDTVPPEVTVAEPEAGSFFNTPKIAVSGQFNEPLLGLTVNGAPAQLDGSSFRFANLALSEGENTVRVVAIDRAGNAGSAELTVVLDTLPPQLTLDAPPAGLLTNVPALPVTGHADEPLLSAEVNGQSAALSDPQHFTLEGYTLTEGDNELTVTVRDRAGNAASASATVTLDTLPPAAPVFDPAKSPTNVATLGLAGQAEAGSTVRISSLAADGTVTVLGVVGADGNGRFALPGVALSEGNNCFSAVAIDAAGNQSPASADLAVVLDTMAPQIAVQSPAAGLLTKAAQIDVAGSVDEPVAGVTVAGLATTVSGQDFSKAAVPLQEGSNILQLEAVDLAGNHGSASVSLTRDSTPPPAPQLDPVASPTNQALATLSGSAEAGAGVALRVLRPDGSSESLGTLSAGADGRFSLAAVPLVEGENTLSAVASDAAGNASEPATANVLLDTVAPVITVTSPAEGSVSDALDIVVTGSVDEVDATLTIDGIAVPLENGAFSHPATLQPGSNTLILLATDPAGNVGTASVTLQADGTPPTVTISAPLPGTLTSQDAVTVTGSVDEPLSALALNGQSVPVTGLSFSLPASLAEGANLLTVAATDRAGNVGSAAVKVIRDSQPPQLTLDGPASAAAGGNIALHLAASDASPLSLVELRSAGTVVWSGGGTEIELDQSVPYSLPPGLAAGGQVTLVAAAIDAAGNRGEAQLVVGVAQGASGPGYLQGEVFDDSRGLPLDAAAVSVRAGAAETEVAAAVTVADGSYFFELPAGDYLLRLGKDGYSEVVRPVTVQPAINLRLRDARLTPESGAVQRVDATGGTLRRVLGSAADAPALELTVPADALADPVDLRLLPISNQGLAVPLPLGWAPLAAWQLQVFQPDSTEPTPDAATCLPGATLGVPLPAPYLLPDAPRLLLARYDGASHAWMAAGTATPSSDGSALFAELAGAGQYALLLADATAAVPPEATLGQPLPGSPLLGFDPATVSAAGRVIPYAAPPRAGLLAAGEVTLAETVPGTLVSGTLLTGRVTERFDLSSGETLQPAGFAEDLGFYRAPCVTNFGGGLLDANPAALRTTFPVSPSRDFTVVDLLQGKIGIDILPPDSGGAGVLVGPAGARLVDNDGNILDIPAGALAATVPVQSRTLAAESARVLVGADFTLLRAVEIDLARQSLTLPATLSVPAPEGLDPALPLVLARQIEVAGRPKLKLVGALRRSGSMVVSAAELLATLAGAPVTVTLPSIAVTGRYYLLQAKAPLGYLRGAVAGSAGAPFAGALVESDAGSLVDLTAADGRYLIPLAVAPFTATALDPARQDAGTGSGTIPAPCSLVDLDLAIAAVPPRVTQVDPAAGATGVAPSVAPRVTFSEPLDRASVDAAAFRLVDAAGQEVAGALSFNPDSSEVTFYPAASLASEASYTLSVAGTVRDLQGYPLGQPLTVPFTVRDTTPPAMPPAGAITATFPDADGQITVTGTQGSVELGVTVLVINDTSGEIVGVQPATNGAFSAKIAAQLGDQLQVVMMDAAGNQTLISYLTFKSEDGRYLVTAKGGKVEGAGGSELVIPEGALLGSAVVKLTRVLEADLPHPVPAEGKFLGAVNIETGNVPFQKPISFSVPVPDGMRADAVPFVARPVTRVNADGSEEQVYEIVDSAKVVGDRLITACPPFDGPIGYGTFVFISPQLGSGIISGTTYRDMNGDGIYTAGIDQPIQGAVVRSPGAWNFIAVSNANGHYATFGFTATGACRNFAETAIHPLTMFSSTNTVTACDAPYAVSNFNFKLADANTEVPDKTPPLVQLSLYPTAGQAPEAKITAGTVPLGTELQVELTVDDVAIDNVKVAVEYLAPGALAPDSSSLQVHSLDVKTVRDEDGEVPAVFRYSYQADPLKPAQLGFYTLVVTATDKAGNVSIRRQPVRAIILGDIPKAIDGAPFVTSLMPADQSPEVRIDSDVTALFSEVVDKVDAKSFTLTDLSTGKAVPATVTTGLENGTMQAVLHPQGNLYLGREYQIALSDQIVDQGDNPTHDNEPMPLKPVSARFTTQQPKGYDLVDGFQGGRDIAFYFDPAAQGLFSYVTTNGNGWRVVDVTDTTRPEVVYPEPGHVFPTVTSYRGVAVGQDTGILGITENTIYPDGNQYGYVRFYDLNNKHAASPVLVGQEKLAEAYSGIPGRLALNGNYAYIATINAGVQVVDVDQAIQEFGSSSDGSTIVGGFDSVGMGLGHPSDILVYRSDRAVLLTNAGILATLDLKIPQVPMMLARFRPDSIYFNRIGIAADFLLDDGSGSQQSIDLGVAYTRDGRIRTIDLTTPTEPRLLGIATDADGNEVTTIATDIAVSRTSGLAFVSTLNAVQIFDIKDPSRPRLLDTITQLPGETGEPLVLGGLSGLVENNGWIYLASENTGMVTLGMNSQECIGGVNCGYNVERTYHLGQYDNIPTPDYTDSYKETSFTLDKPSRIKVSLFDRSGQLKKIIVPATDLDRGTHSFLLDYQTVRDAGISADVDPDYLVKVDFVPADGGATSSQLHFGRISERSDGRIYGQTLVDDVMLQDGSLNLSREDFAFPGRGPQLAFRRSYSNRTSPDVQRPLGNGWSHSLDMQLVPLTTDEYAGTDPEPTWVPAQRGKFYGEADKPQGEKHWTRVLVNGTTFTKVNGNWVPDRGHHGTLSEDPGNSFVFTAKDGTRYTYGYPDLKTRKPTPVLAISDRNSNQMVFGYTGDGLLATVTDASDRTCSFSYTYLPICDQAPMRLTSVSCTGGVQLAFGYTAAGDLSQVTRGEKVEQYRYAREDGIEKGDFNLVKVIDSNQNVSNYTYFGKDEVRSPALDKYVPALKSQDVVKSVAFPDGATARFSYNDGGDNRRQVTDPRGKVTTYDLNPSGNPKTITESLGKTTHMTWSVDEGKPDNVMTSRTDARGNTTSYEYDVKGNVTQETDPYGHTIQTSWNQTFSLPRLRTDRNGVVTKWDYDARGNLRILTDGDGKQTSFSYDPNNGDLLSRIDPLGNETRFTYDSHGNPDTVTGPEGSVVDSDYDVRGRKTAETDANGNRTEFAYDDLDHPATVTFPVIGDYALSAGSTRVKTTVYDTEGNLKSETDRVGLTLEYAYTPRNQVKTITRKGGVDGLGVKSFAYDENGNLTSESDWKGVATTHHYDELNRRDSTTNRLGDSMAMGYDLAGNLTQVTDYAGRVTAYEYDKLNRQTKVIQPQLPGQDAAGEIVTTYYKEADPKTNLKTVTDAEGDTTTFEYNGRYLKTKRINALGDEHLWGYDDAGNLAQETDEAGHVTRHEYDRQNRLRFTRRNVSGRELTTEFRYDPAGNRTLVIDPRGMQTRTDYDQWNRPWQVTDADGYVRTSEKDGAGREVRTSDGNGVERSFARDARGLVLTATDGEGQKTVSSYDLNDNVETIENARGFVTRIGYDAEDRKLLTTEAEGTPEERVTGVVEYDPVGNPVQVRDGNGNLHKTDFNGLNLPWKQYDPKPFDDQYVETLYDKNGKPVSVRNRRNYVTTTAYDELGRVHQVTDPLQQAIVTTYDAVGNVKTVLDKRGILTENAYDEAGHLLETRRAGVRLVTNEYDAAGNLAATVDANGNRTESSYTGRNLLDVTTFKGPDGDTSQDRDYDGAGNLEQLTDEEGQVTSYTYDKENRQRTVTFAGETTEQKYDEVGNLSETIKPKGNGRKLVYDGRNRLTSVTEGELTSGYRYDANDNRLSQTDPRGNVVEFSYDELNRKTSQIQRKGAGDLTVKYDEYDAEGNLTQLTDAMGRVFRYEYDALNRQTVSHYPQLATPFLALQQVETGYDANNNVKTVKQTKQIAGAGVQTDLTENTYDDFDRLQSSTQRGLRVGYGYDANGNRTHLETVNGATDYHFDHRNRLETATVGSEVTTYHYTPAGRLESIAYPNGTSSHYTYYPSYRVETIRHQGPNGLISSFAYEYDANGNRTLQVEVQQGTGSGTVPVPLTTAYHYDDLDRLKFFRVTAATGVRATTYSFEGYNRKTEWTTQDGATVVSKSYSYDETDWLTGTVDRADPAHPVTVAYAYDNNGNTLSKTKTGGTGTAGAEPVPGVPVPDVTTYTYDAANRLVQAEQNGAVEGKYDYNAKGMRIRHYGSERGDIEYFYDDGAVLEEYTAGASGGFLAHYRYGDRLLSLDAPSDGGVQYYLHDALGSTVDLTDGAGGTKVSYTLDPWGHITDQVGSSVNRMVFTGQEHDEKTGLIYFGARYYDPDAGRFLTQDSYLGEVGVPPSLHRYLYAYSNPTVFVDLMGYASLGNDGLPKIRYRSPIATFLMPTTATIASGGSEAEVRRAAEYSIKTTKARVGIVAGAELMPFAAGALPLVPEVAATTTGALNDLTIAARARGGTAIATTPALENTLYWGGKVLAGAHIFGLLTSEDYRGAYMSSGPIAPLVETKTAMEELASSFSAYSRIRQLKGSLEEFSHSDEVLGMLRPSEPRPRSLGAAAAGDGIENQINQISRGLGDETTSPWLNDKRVGVRTHIEQFRDGGSFLVPKSAYDDFIAGQKYIGRADGQFITTQKAMDELLKNTNGDILKINEKLGTNWNEPLYRIDIYNPLLHNTRLPSGFERGADPEKFRWGGYTNGGMPEAIIDQIQSGEFRSILLPGH